MQRLGLHKAEKLRHRDDVEQLFAAGQGTIAYPLRAVYRWRTPADGEPTARFMITIPKKKIRHAVQRVLLRRRVREAYRLHHQQELPLSPDGMAVDIAFIYLSGDIAPFHAIESRMTTILQRIAAQADAASNAAQT